MALTELQRKRLIEGINSLPINTVLSYFVSGEIKFSDVPGILAERKQYIEEKLNSMPNPVEQKEWKMIESQASNPTQSLLESIEAYIRHWEGIRPASNHVDEAREMYEQVARRISAISEEYERQAWDSVDVFSKQSLIDYLSNYPKTVHKSEIDDSLWGLTNKESVDELQQYIALFSPQGNHTSEANNYLMAIVEWNNVKNSEEIFLLDSYIKSHPESPFIQQAQILMINLKQKEKARMRNNSNEYDVSRFLTLLDKHIMTENELIHDGIITRNVLETLRKTDINNDLPDIKKAINNSKPECKEGFTDVYFFGVPSTGKTCVLMGMSRSNSLHINLASGGGDYASALQQYTDVGVTVQRTPGTFVTTLEATISNDSENAEHRINLVEMSGEEFAFEIAGHPNHVFTFEDMGTGATELLKNSNRKVFFLIIDPTADLVRINREIVDGYNEDTGDPIVRLDYCVVNQRTVIQKMVDLFKDKGNAEIMKRVDSIHIIMTKSDILGNPVEREKMAYSIFQEKFRGDILAPLITLCREYNINAQTDFHPKLYTFSLGRFYIGGLYEYEQHDSNKLVKAIRNSTHALKNKTWWDRLKETVN